MRIVSFLPSALGLAVMLGATLLAPDVVQAQGLLPGGSRPSLFQPAPGRVIVAAAAAPLLTSIGPGLQCRFAIRTAERAAGIPTQLMAAIGRVESGRAEPDGSVNPWPWSINVEGEGHVYESKAEAIAAVRGFQAAGQRSIDVGCMQVNLQYHPDAFSNLEQAFDPVANANYAARFLVQLHDQTGTWPTATAWYHSATPDLGADYARRVMAVWPEEQQRHDDAPPPAYASSYANGYASGFNGGFKGGFSNGFANGFMGASGAALAGGAVTPRIIPLAAGAVGRGLAAYRAAPIPVVSRPTLTMPASRDASRPG